MKILKESLKLTIFPFVFGIGFISFLLTNKTHPLSYASFRYLFVFTNGKVNNFHARLISLISKPKIKQVEGILGTLSEESINSIAKSIQKKGYHEFDISLTEELISNLYEFAITNETKCIDIHQKGVVYLPQKIKFDPASPKSPRYQFESNTLVQNKTVREIIFDPTFRTIAARYLECQPILDIVTMWWSVPFNQQATAQSAQMYHFDMDRFKFLKFFFYITDVHSDNGPHCYIEGSHITIPKQARKDGRLNDEELLSCYSKDLFKEFTGKKGTILAVDTRGFHKGKPLVKDNRLLFQIQFSNSLFGAPYEPLTINAPTEQETKDMKIHSRTYQLMK